MTTKRGRPASHGERYMIRLTAAEKRAWTTLARKAGLTLPQWIRLVCTMHAERAAGRADPVGSSEEKL